MRKFFACFLVVFLLCGCNFFINEPLRPVEWQKVSKCQSVFEKEFFGYVKSSSLVDLSFQIEGAIKSVLVKEGQFVKSGQVLATLDSPLYEIEAKEAKYNLDDAIIQYKNAKSYFERIEKLHAAGGISHNDRDSAEVKMNSAKYQIEIARKKLEYQKKRANYDKILAPYDGQVVSKILSEGRYVKAGESVLTFQNNKSAEAVIFVPQNFVNELKVGQEALVLVEAQNKKYGAKIKEIRPTSLETQSFRVKLIIPSNSPEIKDGMSVSAIFKGKNKTCAILISTNSIFYENNSAYVFKLLPDKKKENTATVQKTAVKLGEIQNGQIEVLEGLMPNDLIVTKGLDEMAEGKAVKLK